MRRWLAAALCCILMALAAPAPARAQAGALQGTVRDAEGRPLEAVGVAVAGTGRRAVTDAGGRYRLSGLPPGEVLVRATRPGYEPAEAAASVPAGGAATLDLVLRLATVGLDPVQAIVGSRVAHTAAHELAVPVDVFPARSIREQGTPETAAVLAQLAPSVNFPRQSVSDATDIVRPFTLRGLSPDHTLVLVNGKRYHRSALVHVFGAGMGAGSSGVDLNTLPAGAIDRIEVLRDGAAAQYGSDAIAGVVNVVLRRGAFAPTFSADAGRYAPDDWKGDGEAFDVNGAWGVPLGRGWIALFGEVRSRAATNRAGADPEDQLAPGDADEVAGGRVITKNNPVPQPTYHWGDGAQRDLLAWANALVPLDAAAGTLLYASGGASYREGEGNGYFRHGMDARNWTEIHPLGFLPAFEPRVTDLSAAAGVRGSVAGWTYDLGGTLGHNHFRYRITHSLNTSLGPCLDAPCAPGLDGVMGTADDPGIPNQTEFDAGALGLWEMIGSLDLTRQVEWGLASPVHVAAGVAVRRESYRVAAGEPASYLQGGHLDRNGDPAPPGSQVFPGFQPANEADEARTNLGVYLDLEAEVAPGVLAAVAGRFERYSDFGERLTGKLALRWQPSETWTLRGALGTGFRAPSLSQSWYGSTVTNFAPGPGGDPVPFDVGIFPVGHPAARALGARPLREETSVNASAGLAVTPLAGLTLTADYFFIDLDGRILLTTDLAGPEVEAILAAQGLSAVAARYFTNAVHSRTRGVDVTAAWTLPLAPARRLELTGALNWTRTDIVDDIPLPPELAGTGVVLIDPFFEGGLLALEDERPEWRGTVTGRYTVGPWSLLSRASVYGPYRSSLYSYSGDAVQRYGAEALFDAEAGREVGGRGRVAVGVRNLFDNFPDEMIPDNSFGIFLYPPASPFGYNGRYVYVRLEWGLPR